MRHTIGALLATMALGSWSSGQDLVGKPLSVLAVSHPIQGTAWDLGDLLDSVVVLEVFQLG